MLLKWKRRAGAVVAMALIAVVRFVDLPALAPMPHGPKPMFPVLTRIEMLNAPDPGGLARILATVTAWVPGETILWTLELPPGLELAEGPASWSGRLDRGASMAFEITVAVPDGAPHEVNVLARIEGRPEARNAAMLPIDLGGFDGPRSLEQRISGDGVTYIQYPGETRPREGNGR